MLAEADMGITSMAMDSSQNSRFAADNVLLVKFFDHPKLNQSRSAEEGRPIYEEIPYIQIMQPGNKDNIIQRPATDMDKHRFAEHFNRYKARASEDHLEGTLLESWPGVTRSQCEELRFFNVRTVEQLACMSDSNSQGMMGINLLKQKAAAYLEDADANAAKQALADQKTKNEELMAMIAELSAKVDAQEEAPKKRKRRTPEEMAAARAEQEE